MNIQEIRQNYPQYHDLRDQELANAIHSKYYSDMPKDKFYSKIGFNPDSEENYFNLPRSALAGFAKFGHGLLNTPHNITGLFSEKLASKIPYQQEYDFAKLLGQKGKGTLLDKLIQGAVEFAPSMAIPGANLGRAGKIIEKAPKVGRFLSEAISHAIPQGAFGATQNKNPLEGIAEGAGGAAMGTAAAKIISKLAPKNLFRGVLSPEELKNNLEITKGTNTGLGQVIESPFLNRVQENILPYTIGSGAEKTMQKNAKNIQSAGSNLVNKLRGDIAPEDFGEKIHEALKNAAHEVEQIKSGKFNATNQKAEDLNVNTSRRNLRETAQDILNQVESDPDLAKFMSKTDLDLLKSLSPKNKGFDIGAPINVITGKPLKVEDNFSLRNTDILRGKIGEHAYEAAVKGEKPKAAIYTKLKKALEKDVENSIEQSGNDSLKQLHKEAMDYYKKEYAPFQDKDILKFTRQGGDPDLILNHFLKGGRNDRSVLLQKLSKAVSPKDNPNNILASSYLSRSIDDSGQVNPIKLRALYNNLGTNQRKVLFGTGDLHKEIKNYVDLVGKNHEAFNLMFNPKTGARNTELIAKLAQLGAAGSSGLSSAIPLALGALGGRAMNKALTSPSLREIVVNGMLNTKNVKHSKFPKLAAMITEMSNKDNEQKPLELELIGGHR